MIPKVSISTLGAGGQEAGYERELFFKQVKKLNKLIDRYNHKPSVEQFTLIYATARHLNFQCNNINEKFLKDKIRFSNWYKSLHLEGEALRRNLYTNDTKMHYASLDSAIIKSIPTYNRKSLYTWQQLQSFIVNKILIKGNSNPLLARLSSAYNCLRKSGLKEKDEMTALYNIQIVLLTLINQEKIKIFGGKKKYTDELYQALNYVTEKIYNKTVALSYTKPTLGNLPIFKDIVLSKDREGLRNIITQLNDTDNIDNNVLSIPDSGYQLKYLGGQNNINWVATKDTDESIQYVVRVENRVNNTPLILAIENDPVLSQIFARDEFNIISQVDNKDYTLAVSEYFSEGSFLDYRTSLSQKKGMTPQVLIYNILCMAQQVTETCILLKEKNLVYTDIKAENFLVRVIDNTLELYIADKKSLMTLDYDRDLKKEVYLTMTCFDEEKNLDKQGAGNSFRLPEFLDHKVDAEKAMVYQIGILLHVLMEPNPVNDNPEYFSKNSGDIMKNAEAIGTSYYKETNGPGIRVTGKDQLGNDTLFGFNGKLFSTKEGMKIQSLIEQCTDTNPVNRLSLSDLNKKLSEVVKTFPEYKQEIPLANENANLSL